MPSTAAAPAEEPVRYGPLDVDLKPRDQLRPLLPTWNPPPTRPPRPEELEVSTRLRFKYEDRWWAATVRALGDGDDRIRVAFDGWPSRHDEWVTRDCDRLYLHESFHAEYEAPPIPQRYQRPPTIDAEGNPVQPGPRPPRPKVFDPEKERMKRALRPPLPYNPEKERLKRLLRGQYAPPIENYTAHEAVPTESTSPAQEAVGSDRRRDGTATAVGGHVSSEAGDSHGSHASRAVSPSTSDAPAFTTVSAAAPPPPAPPPPGPPPEVVEWLEVPGGVNGARAFRHATSGEVRPGRPPSGWVELLAEGGGRYYWHVERNVTQWDKPN